MARPQTYQPKILELLRQHPEGMTRDQITAAVGCSPQLVHKVIAKGKLPEGDRQHLPIVVVGKASRGRELVALAGDSGAGGMVASGHRRAIIDRPELRETARVDRAGTSNAHGAGCGVELGERLRVVAMTVEGDVTVETDQGARVVFHCDAGR